MYIAVRMLTGYRIIWFAYAISDGLQALTLSLLYCFHAAFYFQTCPVPPKHVIFAIPSAQYCSSWSSPGV